MLYTVSILKDTRFMSGSINIIVRVLNSNTNSSYYAFFLLENSKVISSFHFFLVWFFFHQKCSHFTSLIIPIIIIILQDMVDKEHSVTQTSLSSLNPCKYFQALQFAHSWLRHSAGFNGKADLGNLSNDCKCLQD